LVDLAKRQLSSLGQLAVLHKKKKKCITGPTRSYAAVLHKHLQRNHKEAKRQCNKVAAESEY
jgi:hypothetical protein